MNNAQTSEYLNKEAVAHDLAKWGIKFEILESIGSTNDYLREKAKKGQITGPYAVLAVKQTEGKGTKGRKWISDDFSCLKMSLCVPFKREVASESTLSPAVALAACRALLKEGFSNIEIKWPNDLLKSGRKVGGILLESIRSPSQTYVIVGIGLNLYPSEVVALQLDRQPAFLLKKASDEPSLDRRNVVTSVLRECAKAVFNFRFGNGMPEPAEWNKHDRLFGKNVTVKFNQGNEAEGIASGIDEFGRFLLKTKDGKTHRLADGEVEIVYGRSTY